MTQSIEKRGVDIGRKINDGVVVVCSFGCVLNTVFTLMSHDHLLPLSRRFRYSFQTSDHISSVILWKLSADKGGGSWRLWINPINVKHQQHLRHVQPVCEFTANDSRENISAVMFHEINCIVVMVCPFECVWQSVLFDESRPSTPFKQEVLLPISNTWLY